MTCPLDAARRAGQLPAALRPALIDRPATEGPDAPPVRVEPPTAVLPLPEARKPSPWSYEIATLDDSRRFYPRDAVQLLGWQTNTSVMLQAADDRVVASRAKGRTRLPQNARRLDIDARSRLRLPFAMRQRLGLDVGDRLIVATNRRTRQVVIMPTTELDRLTEVAA